MPMRLSGLVTGMDTEALVGQLMSAQSMKKKKVSGAKTKLEWKKDAWKDLNKKLTTFYNGTLSKMRLPSSYNLKKATASDTSKATIDAQPNAVVGNYTMEVKDIASAQFVTSGKTSFTSSSQKLSEAFDEETFNELKGKKITINGPKGEQVFEIGENTKVSDFANTVYSAGLNASYDAAQKKFFISSKETGAANSFSISDGTSDGSVLSHFGLGNIEATQGEGSVTYKYNGEDVDSNFKDPSSGMALVGAKDSHIILNGADLYSAASTVNANGLSINLIGKTTDTPITFSVSNDIDKVYEDVKKFLKEYNDLMKEMNEKYNADSSKGYEPLTSEEKRALSDDEVEEWEKKIKDSLFRRDSKLEGIMSGMRSNMAMTTKVGDKTYSLSSFGIMTSTNYREGGLLHIYGDPDDDVYSGETDKLKKALTENPDDTITALTNIFESLRKDMFNRMGATEYSSGLTFYDDKQMDLDLDKYKQDLKSWDDKIAEMEEQYYKKFAAMESAMAKLQSQQSSLGGLLGMG